MLIQGILFSKFQRMSRQRSDIITGRCFYIVSLQSGLTLGFTFLLSIP